jgi:hypothetical protein
MLLFEEIRSLYLYEIIKKFVVKKGKAIPVTGRGNPKD